MAGHDPGDGGDVTAPAHSPAAGTGAGAGTEEIVEVGHRPIREVNADIRKAVARGSRVRVQDTLSRHNLGVALPEGADLVFEGSVGYYCGGLNNGATIRVERNAGWGLGEAMASGVITVDGYAGMAAGASMLGGLLHVRGDAGPRTGVAQKGGDIVVEGSVGFLSGFMAHAGRIIVLADAADAAGDSLWGGEMWVAGNIGSPGVDSRIVEPDAEEVASVEDLLSSLGVGDVSRRWKKIVSGQKLWHFESRDAQAWLMI
ncbi:MAG TPA: glutamate synthase [Acidimicrobiales bacterium]|nr:glutamate synthase [Acidimicrobiales bacterium]